MRAHNPDARMPKPTTSVEIGETIVDIPSMLEWRDDDGTLVAYLPGTNFANLRFTLLTIERKDGNLDGGVRAITRRAAEDGAKLETSGRKVWYYTTEPASEGSEGSRMHYWRVGMDDHMLVISCFVDSEMQDSAEAASVLSCVQPAIHSFRKAGWPA